jgi:acyl carrier protein
VTEVFQDIIIAENSYKTGGLGPGLSSVGVNLKGEAELDQDIEKTVHEFIIRNFLFEDDGSLTAETSFLDNGIIDSTGVLELITFVEETYCIEVDDHEIVPENLDSIRNIVSFVERKLNTLANTRCTAVI